ncbi:hypothetical protein [Pseudaminobacter soli (ex Li et al. 2025)]|uniref:hypothetical protein n=1 Tax=Pseudaminobacter soli (ex Li et al. 2025) TaxID=1295366 RepID=UPI0011B283F7|nr:hypothetical protein [Mesorhizobium soli]
MFIGALVPTGLQVGQSRGQVGADLVAWMAWPPLIAVVNDVSVGEAKFAEFGYKIAVEFWAIRALIDPGGRRIAVLSSCGQGAKPK